MRTCPQYCLLAVDTPNANSTKTKTRAKQTNKTAPQAQLAADQATTAAGGVAPTNHGEALPTGRKRTESKYEALVLNCHAGHYSCTTNEGPILQEECKRKHCRLYR